MGKKTKKKKKNIFNVSLKELRKSVGYRQKDIKKFKQASVSKIESRKDIKISTLIEYLKSINLGIEINAIQKDNNGKEINKITLINTENEKNK